MYRMGWLSGGNIMNKNRCPSLGMVKDRLPSLQQQQQRTSPSPFFLSPFHMFSNHRSIPTKKKRERPSLSPKERLRKRDSSYERATPTTVEERIEILLKFGFSIQELQEAEELREKIRLYRYLNINR